MTGKSCLCCQSEDITVYSEGSFLQTGVLQCNNCLFKFNDITDEAEVSSFLNDYYSNDYWQVSRAKGFNGILKKLASLVSRLNIRPLRFSHQRALSQLKFSGVESGRALEIGAGRGALSSLLASRGFGITALEPDRENARRMHSANPDIKIVNCYFNQFQSDELFDVVFVSHVLEHDLHPIDFLEKVKGLLDTEGIAFIEVPNADNPVALGISVHDEPHLTHFSRKSIEHLFPRLGFDIMNLESVSYGYHHRFLKQVFRTLKFIFLGMDIYKVTSDGKGDAYRMLIRNSVVVG